MTTLEHTTPDLEDLAAYVDGRLDPERRRAVEERLARDEGYYEVFLETTRFLQEEGLTEADGAPAPAAQRHRPPTWLPLLAAAVLTLAVVGSWRLIRPADPLTQLGRLDAQKVVAVADWDQLDWRVVRSVSSLPPGLTREELFFRYGVRTVDLRVALAAGDRQQAAAASARLAALAEELELFQEARLAALADNLATGATPLRNITAQFRHLEASVTESLDAASPEPQSLATGQWLQATRLAALGENHEVLADLVAHAPRLGHHPELADALAALEEAAEDEAPDALIRAVESLDKIAAVLGG